MRACIALALIAPLVRAQTELSEVAGRFPNELLGADVGVVGDLDGDGSPEWLVTRGAETPESQRPELFVLSGRDGSLLYDVPGAGPMDTIFFLQSVLGLGDVDLDGVPDFAFGNSSASVDTRPNRGRVDVRSGRTGRRLYLVEGPVDGGAFGNALARLGDVDLDGRPDFLVGQIGSHDENAWLVSGASGTFLRHVHGPRGGDPEFGWSVTGAGDLDRDSVDDFAVGTQRKGVVYVYSGARGRLLATFGGGRSFGQQLADLGDVDGDGFHELLIGETNMRSVWIVSVRSGTLVPVGVDALVESLSCAGDLDGDGRNDFWVGAGSAERGAGIVRAFSTRTLRMLAKITGAFPGERFGASVAGGADFDLDGRPDVLVGAPGFDASLRGGDAGGASSWSLAPAVRR